MQDDRLARGKPQKARLSYRAFLGVFLRAPQRYPARDGAALVSAGIALSSGHPGGCRGRTEVPPAGEWGYLEKRPKAEPKAERWFQGQTGSRGNRRRT